MAHLAVYGHLSATSQICYSPSIMALNANGHLLATSRRHPIYWFDDGSLIVRAQDDAFKVHATLLTRHSPILSSLPRYKGGEEDSDVPIVHIPDHLNVKSQDFEALLAHIYHDSQGVHILKTLGCQHTTLTGCISPACLI